MSSSNFCFLTCIQISEEVGKVVWYSHLFKNFSQLVVIHTVKGIVNKAEVDVFLAFSCFFDDQSWVFIGRTDAEAEIPILLPHYVKNWLSGKDPDAGRDWGQEEKGTTEDEMAGWHRHLNECEFG